MPYLIKKKVNNIMVRVADPILRMNLNNNAITRQFNKTKL